VLQTGVNYFILFKAKTAINRLCKKRGGSSFALVLKIGALSNSHCVNRN